MTSDPQAFELIKRSIAAGDLDEAEAALLSLPDDNHDAIQSDYLETLEVLARIYLKKEQHHDAIRILKQRIAAGSDGANLYFDLANAYLASDQLPDSVRAFRQGLTIDRQHPQAYNNLGIALKQQGNLNDAETAFQSAVKIAPQLGLPHRNLGELHRIRGNRKIAIAYFEDAIRLNPDDAEAHNGIGMTVATFALPEKAIEHFRKAIELDGAHKEAANNLAILLSATGQSSEAVELFKQTIQRNPDFSTARVNLGSLLIELGQFKEAIHHLEETLRINPRHALALHQLGDLSINGEYEFTDIQLEQIKIILRTNSGLQEDRIAASFTYAGILEKQGQYSATFEAYTLANKLNREAAQAKGIFFHSKRHADKIQQAINFFDDEFLSENNRPNLANKTGLPIFVVGMPRSGTTLIEQIISSHPQSAGAGELAAIEELSLQIAPTTKSTHSYPECLRDLSPHTSQLLSQQYLDKLSKNLRGSQRIVDKTWYNFYFLGLISVLFPKARVVHCLRDPRDVAVSCFFSNFNSIHWSWRIEDIIVYYTSYLKLMKHWKSVLPIKIFDVSYEHLVRNQEENSRQLIKFCGLDWSDDCLTFYNNQRAVQTASRVQVRKPIYDNSIARWKHFENELSMLEEWKDAFVAL